MTTKTNCPICICTIRTHKAAREARAQGKHLVACSNGGTSKLHYHQF